MEPPTLSCPKNFNISSDFNVTVNWKGGYATDNIGVASVTFDPPNGTRFPSDSKNKITLTAVDTSGNKASCIFEVVIKG